MSDTLKEIADNLGVGLVNGGYLSGIAQFYGVNLSTSTDLMKDILTAVGGNPATSTDYLKDIVLALGGTVTINANWMEAWEDITNTAGAFQARVLADGVKYLWENPPEYRLLSTNARQVTNKMKWKFIIKKWEKYLKTVCVEVSDLCIK